MLKQTYIFVKICLWWNRCRGLQTSLFCDLMIMEVIFQFPCERVKVMVTSCDVPRRVNCQVPCLPLEPEILCDNLICTSLKE